MGVLTCVCWIHERDASFAAPSSNALLLENERLRSELDRLRQSVDGTPLQELRERNTILAAKVPLIR